LIFIINKAFSFTKEKPWKKKTVCSTLFVCVGVSLFYEKVLNGYRLFLLCSKSTLWAKENSWKKKTVCSTLFV